VVVEVQASSINSNALKLETEQKMLFRMKNGAVARNMS
jgi:hypothetical protein